MEAMMYTPEVDTAKEPGITCVEAIAEAWASIDGKLKDYELDRDAGGNLVFEDGCPCGYYDGYQADATELLTRIEERGWTMTTEMVTKSSGNVFEDIGLDDVDDVADRIQDTVAEWVLAQHDSYWKGFTWGALVVTVGALLAFGVVISF
jgi:hypothetical protein